MMDSMFLGAYWRDRAESAGECARRLNDFLRTLGRSATELRTWRSLQRRAVVVVGSDDNIGGLRSLFEASVNQKDFGSEPMPELGYQVGLWNGSKDAGRSASLSVACGLCAGVAGLSNAVALRFPSSFVYEESTAPIEAAFESAIQSFVPDWAWVGTDELRDLQVGQTPIIGILTFLRNGMYDLDVPALMALGAAVQPHRLGTRIGVDPRIVPMIMDGLRNAVSVVE